MSNELSFQDRLPPHHNGAERSVLGACLIDEEVAPSIISIIKPEYFYKSAHKIIFQAITDLAQKQEGVDILSVSNYLESQGKASEVGGAVYLAELQAQTMTAANAITHAGIIKEKFLLRKLISASHETIRNIFDSSKTTQEILDSAEQKIFEVADTEIQSEASSIDDILKRLINNLDSNDWKPQDGIKTGFRKLDKLTLGFHPGELIIIAARPSMGKTSLALNIVKNMAMRDKRTPVAFFSMEMKSDNIAKNLLCMHGQIDAQRFRSGMLSNEERQNVIASLGELSEAPIYIDDTPGMTPFQLRLSARRFQSRYGIQAIFVDYLQLMRLDGKIESRQIEISKISGFLKSLAMELKIPVIALSQLSRKLEERVDKRPMMSDLRESGSIEQDADTILMLYRACKYDESKSRWEAEVNVVKQRNGPTGTCPLVFIEEHMRFENQEAPPYV